MGNPEPAVWPRIVDSNVKVVNAYDNSVDNLERMDMVNASVSILPHSLLSVQVSFIHLFSLLLVLYGISPVADG